MGHPSGAVHGVAQLFKSVIPRLGALGIEAEACILGRPHPFAAELESAGIRLTVFDRAKWDPRSLADLVGLIRRRRADS